MNTDSAWSSYLSSIGYAGAPLKLKVEMLLPESGAMIWGVDDWGSADWSGYSWWDVTSEVLGISSTRGGATNQRPETGTCSITLKNDNRQFSVWTLPADAFGQNPQYFGPGLVMRYGFYGTSMWFPRFTGIVQSWTESTEGVETLDTIQVELFEPTGVLARIQQEPLGTPLATGNAFTQRMTELLTYSDFPYGWVDRSVNEGVYHMGGPGIFFQGSDLSKNRLQECYLTADSSLAQFRSSRRGHAFTYSFETDWYNYTSWTNPDDTGSVLPNMTTMYLAREVRAGSSTTYYAPYETDSITIDHDDRNIVNIVTGKPEGGSVTTVVVSDTGLGQYGIRNYTRDDFLCEEFTDMTEILSRYLVLDAVTPRDCTVSAHSHPHAQAFLLMLDVERVVHVEVQGEVVFNTMVAEYTEHLTPRSTQVEWTTDITFKPYNASTWWRL